MKFLSPKYLFIFCICFGSVKESHAQNTQLSKTSEGLTLSVTKSAAREKNVVLRFLLTNNTHARVYILVASGDLTAKGVLTSSGEHLNNPQVTSIDVCDAYVIICNSNTDLNLFSYVERSDTIAFGSIYTFQSIVAESDSVSFSVPMIALFSREDGDHAQINRKATARFSFSYIPVNHQ